MTSRHAQDCPRLLLAGNTRPVRSVFTSARETAGCRGPVTERERAEVGDLVPGTTGIWLAPAATTGQARPGLKQKERFEFSASTLLLAVSGRLQIGSLRALQR